VTATLVYTYNHSGLRVAQSVDGGAITFAWDWASGLPELLSDGDALYLVGHETLGQFADGAWTYYLPDAEGLVRQGTDAQGQVVSTWLFDPDGVVLEGPEGPVSHLVCGGVYDWSTGLIYRDGRYFDPLLGIWLALAPLVVVQSWRGRKQKRRGAPWHVVVALLVVGMGGALTACGGGGTPMPPTPTVCTEITTPFGPPLADNAVFVDPPAGGQHVYRPQAQTWTSTDKQMLEPALTDVIDSNFGGPAGFGSLNAALAQFGVSPASPIRVFREPVSSADPDARAGAANPDLIVWQSWVDLGGDPTLQRAILTHEMTHYWDQEHSDGLTAEMKGWINWGVEATDRGTHTQYEDIAEAVRIYFWPDYYEERLWTDDVIVTGAGVMKQGVDASGTRYGATFRQYGWLTGSDQLKLDTSGTPSKTGAVQACDRYDYLECKFTGNCLADCPSLP